MNTRGVLDQARVVARDPRLLLWSLFIVFFPFYVIKSGLPQPADFLPLCMLPLLRNGSRKRKRLPRPMRSTIAALLVFAGYVLLSNFFWTFALLAFSLNEKRGFVASPLFYAYDVMLFYVVFLMYRRYGSYFLSLTCRLALVSVAVQVLLAFMLRGLADRASLTFNNPNQLGYYALLCACLILLAPRRLNLTPVQVSIGLVACSYLALISASRAALASIAALGIVLVLSRVRTMILAGLAFGILLVTSNPLSHALQSAETRIEAEHTDESFAEQRGYDRILANKQYWLLGAGEGDNMRFEDTSAIGAHELHSSAGTLFFCYGIFGSSLFIAFLWFALRRMRLRTLCVIGPVFVFGMAHQGLRFALFWVVLAAGVALTDLERGEKAQPLRTGKRARQPNPSPVTAEVS